MKTLKNIFVLTMAVALLASCETDEVKMNTEIHEDGTCVREIWFHADSASLVNPSEEQDKFVMGVMGNELWEKDWFYHHPTTKDTLLQGQYPMTQEQYSAIADDARKLPEYNQNSAYRLHLSKNITVHARREFRNVEEMADELPFYILGQQIKCQASLTKKFRWFYTDYTYTESYESLAPKFELPLTDYLEGDAMNFWLTGTPNIFKGKNGFEQKEYMDEMEKKFYQYINANMYNDLFKLIAENYELIPNAPLSREEFLAKGKAIIEQRDSLCFHPLLSDEFDNHFDKFLGTDAYKAYREDNPEMMKLWTERRQKYNCLISFKVDHRLTMPGGIVNLLDCRNVAFENGEFLATLDGIRLLAPNYTILATSSVKNDWALWLSALIGLIALVLLISTSRLFVRR